MAVKITSLESGRFVISWDSMENEEPGCINYEIIMETKSGRYEILKLEPAIKGKEKYSTVVEIEGMNEIAKGMTIHVKALKAHNKPTRTEAVAVYP